MPRGKILPPSLLRNIGVRAFSGHTYAEIKACLRVSRTSISRLISKLRDAGVFDVEALNALSDEKLFIIMYPTGVVMPDSDGRINETGMQVLRHDDGTILRPDFKKLALSIIDEKKNVRQLYFDYQDECAAANKAEYSQSVFYRNTRTAVKELLRGANAIMLIDRPYGAECQLDALGQKVTLPMSDGTQKDMLILVICWAASGYIWCCFIEHMSTLEICNAIRRALKFFRVRPRFMSIDNARAMVTVHHKGKEAVINLTFDNFMAEIHVDINANNPYSPTEKSQVEYSNRLIKVRIIPLLKSLLIPRTKQEWDDILMELVEEHINKACFKGGPLSRKDRFETYEMPQALPLLDLPDVVPEVDRLTVGRDYHVKLKGHKYSVPYKYIGRKVLVKYTDQQVRIFLDGTLIAEHACSFEQEQHTTLEQHMPENHRAYKNSNRSYKNDNELIAAAERLSAPLGRFVAWRLTKQDRKRYQGCTGVMHFWRNCCYKHQADQALIMLMREPPERRNYYTLEKIYKELGSYAFYHDGNVPEQTELGFELMDAEDYAAAEPESNVSPWDEEGPEAYLSNASWFDDAEEDTCGTASDEYQPNYLKEE